jgi:hypothetical protein
MKQKDTLINELRSKGMAKGIPRAIMEALCRMLYDVINSNTPTLPDHPTLKAAVQSQINIGAHLLPRGFLSDCWLTALKDFGVEHPEPKIAAVLKLIWFDFTDVIWRNRNAVVHDGDNQARQMEQNTWAAKLLWYLENKHVIARRDQFIMNYTEDDGAAMPCLTRKKMVERLEAVYAGELQLREIGQRTIHSYFQPKISQENNNEEMVLSERPSAAHST